MEVPPAYQLSLLASVSSLPPPSSPSLWLDADAAAAAAAAAAQDNETIMNENCVKIVFKKTDAE